MPEKIDNANFTNQFEPTSESPKFSPGPSSEQLKKFQGPSWKSEIPDVRMQLKGGKDDEEATDSNKALLEHYKRQYEWLGNEGKQGHIDLLIGSIKALKTAPGEKKEQIRKELSDLYPKLCHLEIDEINSVNKYLDNLRGNILYDTRWTIQLFESLIDKVNAPLREKSKLDDEGIALLKMIKRDLLWSHALARISEAAGPSYEVYFDGELQIAQLRTTTRTEILAGDFVRVFSKNIDGLEIADEDKQLVKNTFKNYSPDIKISDYADFEKLKTEGLRERAIEYQDAFSYWECAAVAAHQKNLEKGFKENHKGGIDIDDEQGEHYMKIDKVTFEFLNKVLDLDYATSGVEGKDLVFVSDINERIKVKSSLMNIFAMSKSAEVVTRRYYTTMHELVIDSDLIRKSLEKIKGDSGKELDIEEEISKEATKIIKRVDDRLKFWESLDERSPFDRLADTVIGGMINLDRGLFACGELGWGYEYSKKHLKKMDSDEKEKYSGTNAEEKDLRKIQKDDEGQFVVLRESKLGSIYDNHDLTTVVFWARHIIDYDSYADTRGSLLFPTIGSYRERWKSEPPYWKPTFKEFAKNDPILTEIRDGLQNDIWKSDMARLIYIKGEQGEQPQFYGKIDPGVKKYIEENAWPFVTYCLSKPGGGLNEYYLSFPVFLPTFIEDLNGWRVVSLDEPSAEIKDSYKDDKWETKSNTSVWHRRLEAETKLSELNWKNLNKYAYNWFRVNTDQMGRWFGPLVTLHDYNKLTAEEFLKHYDIPSGTAEKEGGKRARLGGRGSKWHEGIIRAAVLTQNKILSSIQNSDVMNNEDGLGLEAALNSWQEIWISPWINSLLDMPSEVRSVKNYPGTAAQCALASYLQARRIVKSAIKHKQGQVTDVDRSVGEIRKRFKT